MILEIIFFMENDIVYFACNDWNPNPKESMNLCYNYLMSYNPDNKDIVNKNLEETEQWLKDNNISYRDVNNFENVIDIRKLKDYNVSILSAPIIYKIVHAINADLTYAENTYIGSGEFVESLAQQIDKFFHIRTQLDDLSVCDWEVGDVIYTAPVYHLLTKTDRNAQVSYDDLYVCLSELAKKANSHGNYYLAFPRICCGKDKLNWDVVLQMILDIFVEDFNIMLF